MRSHRGQPLVTSGMVLVRRRRSAAAVFAVMALLATGCSGPSAQDAAGAPRSSATAGPAGPSSPSRPVTTSPPPPPVLPEAVRGAAGQRRFARYVIALWGYSLRTDDAAPLFATSFTKRPCGGCARLASTLRQRKREGWYVDFPGARVHGIRLRSSHGVTVADASVTIPPSVSYNLDGTVRNTNPAHPRARFVVQMRFVKKSYRLVGFAVA